MASRPSIVALLPVDRDGVPLVGGDVVREAGGWFSLYPAGRVASPETMAHARDQGGGAFVVLGASETLALIVRVASKTWAGIEALRADSVKEAANVKLAWVDERPVDVATGARTGERVQLYAAMAGFTEDDAERATATAEPVIERGATR